MMPKAWLLWRSTAWGYSSTGLIARMRQNGNVWQEKVCLAMAQLVFLLGQACMWIACPGRPVCHLNSISSHVVSSALSMICASFQILDASQRRAA